MRMRTAGLALMLVTGIVLTVAYLLIEPGLECQSARESLESTRLALQTTRYLDKSGALAQNVTALESEVNGTASLIDRGECQEANLRLSLLATKIEVLSLQTTLNLSR